VGKQFKSLSLEAKLDLESPPSWVNVQATELLKKGAANTLAEGPDLRRALQT